MNPVVLTLLLVPVTAALGDIVISPCDSPDGWSAGVAVTDSPATLRPGRNAAIRWAYADAPVLRLGGMPPDWSSGHALSLWLYSERVLNHRPWIIVRRAEPGGDAGMSYAIPWHPFTGWTHLVIPFDEFTTRAGPLAWTNIVTLEFDSKRSAGMRPPADPATVLLLDDIRVISIRTPAVGEGPRLTDAQFFGALDLERPELATVKAAAAAGDLAGARHAFAEHIRQRPGSRWFSDWAEGPVHANRQWVEPRAEELLDDQFRMGKEVYRPEARIDWSYNPRIYSDGPLKTAEYNALLNRFWHLGVLQTAWWHTRDERYIDTMVRHMVSWVQDCPGLLFLSGNGPYHYAWETLNAASRLGHWWPHAIYPFIDHPAFTDDAIVTLWKSFYEHAEHLMKWPSRGNWLTSESRAVFYTGLLNPEFRRAAVWCEEGIRRLYGQLEREVYPDGLQHELALGYNLSVLRNFSKVLELARLNGRLDALPGDYLDRLERMFNYLLYAAMPDGRTPGRNDSHVMDDITEIMTDASTLFPSRADFLWAASARQQGKAPAADSTSFPYSGHYVMRTGWEPSHDLYLMFDTGPWGAGHQHEDKLGFTLYAYGRQLLTEAGTHQYNHSEERRYVLSTRGHNTVRVDGRDQRHKHVRESWVLPFPFQPLDNPWQGGGEFDFVEGRYELGYGNTTGFRGGSYGYGEPMDIVPVRHTRSILFVKPQYWIVTDTLTPEDDRPHRYESIFHLEAEEAIVDGLTVSTRAPGVNLWIAAAARPGLTVHVVKGQTEPELQGWTNRNFTSLRPLPTALYEWDAAGPCRVSYVLLPTRAGQSNPIKAVNAVPVTAATGQPAAGSAFEILFDDGTRHVYCATTAGAGPCRFGGVATDGRRALVQVDAAGTITRSWQYGGTHLHQR